MSLRYGKLFDSTVRTEYEHALTLAKQRLGTMPSGNDDVDFERMDRRVMDYRICMKGATVAFW